MFAELCARMFSKSTSTFQVVRWFPVSAESFEDAPAAMDIIEGPVRYRRKKKWKSRWAVLRRVNPAADVLYLVLYQDQVSARSRQKEKAFISLDSFSGLQLLNKLDKHYNVIIAITAQQVVRLSFETIEQRSEWVSHLQKHFGQEQSFDGIIPNKQKIKSGEATLRFYKSFFSLTRKDNYRHIGKWNLVDLPHYGAVYGAFAFEVKEGNTGGTYIYYFATKHGRELHQLFDKVCRGTEVGENNYVEPPALDRSSPQRSVSQPDGVPQPNVFKRAWQRLSQRKPRKHRPRNESEPDPQTRRRRRGENKSAFKNRQLPSVPGNERENTIESEVNRDQPPTSPPPSSPVHPLTSAGYEIMSAGEVEDEEDVVDAAKGREGRALSRTSETSAEAPSSCRSPLKSNTDSQAAIEEAETSEQDGYVLVDAMDVEEIVKEAERRLEEKSKKEEEDKLEAQKRESIKDGEKEKEECQKVKLDEAVLPATEEKTPDVIDEKKCKNATDSKGEENEVDARVANKDKSSRRSEGYDNIDSPLTQECEIKTVTSHAPATPQGKPPKLPVRPKSLETKQELLVNPNKGRRGMKIPPPVLILPPGTPSPESLYVNSPPKTADYVNVPGRSKIKNSAIRSRSKTAYSKPSAAKKLNPYDEYDGNDDSIYHSVESLMPGNPAYQNLRAETNGRSHSFDNLPGHAYTNLPGHRYTDSQAYQNISPPGTQAYVNVNAPKRRFQRNQNKHHLNYIQVEGTDGLPGNYGPPSFSMPADQQSAAAKNASSDYTWIDESRTRLLKETARMHSDLRKENLPKVTKKY